MRQYNRLSSLLPLYGGAYSAILTCREYEKRDFMYTQPASTLTPAVIIYLIDISDSMNEPCGSTTKIAMVNLALRAAIKDMVRRSMRDGILQRRYKLAVVAYNNNVQDVLGGVRDLPEL